MRACRLLVLLVLMLLGAPVLAMAPAAGRVLMEYGSTLGPEQVRAQLSAGGGLPYERERVYPTQPNHSAWFWLPLPAPTVPGSLLTLDYPQLDRVTLYWRDGDTGDWRMVAAGDSIAVDDWPVPYRIPALPVPAGSRELLLKVDHLLPIGFPWQVMEPRAFETERQRSFLMLGGYLGFVVLVVVVGVVNAWTLGDRVHLAYAAYVLSLAAAQMSLTGAGGLLLWPGSPAWNDAAAILLPLLTGTLMTVFVRAAVRPLPRRWMEDLLLLTGAAMLMLALSRPLLGREVVFWVGQSMFMLGLPVAMAVLAWHAVRRRGAGGWWLFAGIGMLLLGAALTPLRNFGLLPLNFWTQYGSQLGAALEIPLLLTGLYVRSRQRRDARVRENALNERDPVTGLPNDLLARLRLDDAVQRMAARPGQTAVLRLRIGNLAALEAEHGAQGASVATVLAAGCVRRLTEPGDNLGRLANGDFLLIVERPLGLDALGALAARAVALGLMAAERMPAREPLKFHVSGTVGGAGWGKSAELLRALDQALATIAREPQRTVRLLPALAPTATPAPAPAGPDTTQPLQAPASPDTTQPLQVSPSPDTTQPLRAPAPQSEPEPG